MTRRETSEFYDKWSKMLYASALRVVKDPMEAEEAMQDTIIKFIAKAGQDERHHVAPLSDAQINVWLHKTCIRASIDRLRARKRRDLFAEELAAESSEATESEPSVLAGFDSSRDIQKVRDTLMELPDRYRVILSLFLFEGYDYQEIAQITGQKEVTVRSQYMRGRERLAELLKGKLGND
jgi:RNA polymerase sigma factor (sigma-70 family)